MKFSVAFLLVLATFSSGTVAQRQTTPRPNKTTAKPRSETMRICQGLPIPDGYVIIAYMTSSACPHGAYLLKKQDQYESSLAVNSDPRRAPESAEPAKSTTQRQTLQVARNSAQPPGISAGPKGSTSQTGGRSAPQAGASALSSRPRRVNAPDSRAEPQPTALAGTEPNQSQEQQEAPKLIGSDSTLPLRPPTLANAGTAPAGSPVGASSNAISQPTPEEVDEGDVVRVDTLLVTVPVSVLDRQGRFVPNLTREDFTVFENGVEQPIAYFEPAEKPFTVALLLDTSASTHFHIDEIKEAAIEFAKQLRPQDRVLVITFNQEVLLLTEATNDLNTIETVIDENANTGTSTRLYDAVDLTIQERLNKIKGRKAIVLFTDGVDTSSQEATYQSTLREVEELDALIYPIQYDTTDYMRAMQGAGNGSVTVTTRRSGPFGTTTTTHTYTVPANTGTPIPGTTKADYDRADQYLHALADKTGGRLYQANSTAQLAEAFSRIAEELRRQYSLGYYPKTEGAEGNERRQIRVKVRQPNLAVKARDSYLRSAGGDPNK
jgi:VWFA-related protein